MTEPPSPQAAGLIRTLIPLGSIIGLVGLATAFVSPFLPLFLSQTLQVSPARTALFLFAMPLAAVVVATATARISDRPGMRPRILVVGAIAGTAGFTLFAFLRSYWPLLVVALTVVALAGSLMPQVFAYGRETLDRTHPTRAAMGISSLRMLLSVSWVAGPALGAYLIGAIDFRGLYLATAAAYLIVLAVVTFSQRPSTTDARPTVDVSPASSIVERGPSRAILLGTTVAFVLMQCAGSLGVMAMALFVSIDLHSDVGAAGLVLGLCAALEIPLMLLFGAFASRWPLRPLVLLGGLFGVAYFATASLAGNIGVLAGAQLLNACFISAVAGLGISYFQELLPSALGRATTMFTNTNRISAMASGLIFGVVQVVGYRSAYVVSAALCLAGTASLGLISRRVAVARQATVPAEV